MNKSSEVIAQNRKTLSQGIRLHDRPTLDPEFIAKVKFSRHKLETFLSGLSLGDLDEQAQREQGLDIAAVYASSVLRVNIPDEDRYVGVDDMGELQKIRYLSKCFASSVEDIIRDIAGLEIRQKETGKTRTNVLNWEQDEIDHLTFQISDEFSDVLGWCFKLGEKGARPNWATDIVKARTIFPRYSRSDLDELVNDPKFTDLRQAPHLFKLAAYSHPENPRDLLKKLVSKRGKNKKRL